MITVTIDGKAIEAAPGTTVMETALAHGIQIPHLCYHPELAVSGGCRLCLVEVEGSGAPQASCGLACQDGMVVRTQSDQLYQMRREIIDLFISEHPLHCVICDKAGDCDLQRYAYEFGLYETSHDFELSRTLFQDDNPFFVRDHKYCILCGQCVRACSEIVGADAIEFSGRGFDSHIATPFDCPMVDSTCVFCGNCVQVCPTAALMPRLRLGRGREWELERKRTICGYCGVGCSIEYALSKGQIVYAQGYPEAPVNGEFLCVKGRFGWDFGTSPDRLTQPLVRKDLAYELGLTDEPWHPSNQTVLRARNAEKNFVPVSWEQALDIVSARLAAIIQAQGPDSVAGLASARCTNEENYLFQKLMRATIGTNNVDHCARLCHASTVTGLGSAFGSGAMTNTIRGLRDVDCFLITGSNTAESHPVISYEVIRAAKEGANLILIDPRRVPLAKHATLFLQPRPGTDIHIFLAMMNAIIREGWQDRIFVDERTEGIEDLIQSVQQMTPELASSISGVPVELIERAARLYALGERKGGALANGGGRGRSSILYAMGITQRSYGTNLVRTLASLSMLCGQVGKPSTGVNPLRGQSNVQGACDLGALPDVLPGYQSVAAAPARRAVAAGWGMSDLPAIPGLTVVEMMHGIDEGKVRAMYVMGENPMLSDPDLGHVEAALHKIDFMVVQDIFLSETAELAHVVLPAASSLEKDGTFTNTERRIQLFAPVLSPPGEARPDWQILCDIGRELERKLSREEGDLSWDYPSTAAIMAEASGVTPIYGGVRHERLAGEGLIWPCPTLDHPGTPVLHTGSFSRGRGKFYPVAAQLPVEMPDKEYPLVLTTGRILYHYHTGTMTRRSEGLAWRESRSYAEVNRQDAETAGIRDGGQALITSRRGQIRTQVRFSQRVPPGLVFLSFHWREAPANLLTHDFGLDPVAKIPEYKQSAVRLENPRTARQRGGQG